MHDRKPGPFGPFDSISALFDTLLAKKPDPADVLAEAFSAVERSDKRYTASTDDNGMVIDIDLPGISPRDVTLWVTGAVVIVKHPSKGGAAIATQRYTVSADYDLGTTEGSMADGRLRVRVARAKPVVPRRIVIEYATGSGR